MCWSRKQNRGNHLRARRSFYVVEVFFRNLARPFKASQTTLNHIAKRRLGIAIVSALLLGEALAAGAVAVARADVAPAAPATSTEVTADAGPKNIVQVVNNTNGSLRVKGRMQLGRVPAPQVGPVNIAEAINTCTLHCDTLAVALQINMVNENAVVLAPQNAAVAVNGGCSGCHAVALAIQYNIGSNDPADVPPEVNRMVAAMKAELAHIDASSTSLEEAESEVEGVLAQYQDLVAYLTITRDEQRTPEAAPAQLSPPADSPAPALPAPQPASPNPAGSPSPSPEPSPGVSPSPSPSP